MADLSPAEAVELLDVSRSVLAKAADLRNFVDDHRDLARQAGIETISAEISGILDGGRLRRVENALEEAVSKGRPAQLTEEGLAQLRRAETILADAARQVARHTDYELSLEEGVRARHDHERETERALLEVEEQRLELARAEAKILEGRARVDLEERSRRLERLSASSLGIRAAPSPALGLVIGRLGQERPLEPEPVETDPPRTPKTDWMPIVIIAAVGALTFLVVALSSGAPAPRRRRR